MKNRQQNSMAWHKAYQQNISSSGGVTLATKAASTSEAASSIKMKNNQ